jgi:hypothetical protein
LPPEAPESVKSLAKSLAKSPASPAKSPAQQLLGGSGSSSIRQHTSAKSPAQSGVWLVNLSCTSRVC